MVSTCRRGRLAAITVIGLALAGATPACAQVRVQGDAAALQIDAEKSSLADVLVELSKTLRVRVRASVALDKVISGTYSGSLNQVLTRVLDGYNYVIAGRDTETEVVVVGARGARAIAAAPPPATPRKSLAGEWRSPIATKAAGSKP